MKTAIRILAAGLLCCVGLQQSAGQAPVLDWVKAYENSKDKYLRGDQAGGMVQDKEKNIFYVGYVSEEKTEKYCIPIPNPTGGIPRYSCTYYQVQRGTIVVSKVSPTGEFIWSKRSSITPSLGEYKGAFIALDSLGNVYVTVNVSTCYPSSSGGGIGFSIIDERSHCGAIGILIWKLDRDGNTVWNRPFFGMGVSATHLTGSTYLMINFQDTLGGRDFFLWKINASGNHQLIKHFSSPYYEAATSIHIDGQANLYVTGIFFDTLTIPANNGSISLVSAGDADIFVMKLNSAGNCIWAKSIGGPYRDDGIAGIDRYNNLYLTGNFSGEVDFDPGPGTFVLTTPAWRVDAFVLKLDQDGNFVWAKQVREHARGSAVAASRNGCVYVATINYLGAQVTKYDPNSNWVWTGSIPDSCSISSLAVTDEENVLLYGDFSGRADFDPGRRKSIRQSGGLSDIFIAQWSECHPSTGIAGLVVCDTFNEHGYVLTQSGLYTLDIINAAGCDSTLTLDLTVITVDTSVTQTDSTLVANAIDATLRWLACENGQPIPGETFQVFRPKVHGHYAAEVTYQGCTHVSSCRFARGAVISLFPNPTTGQFTIDMGGDYYNLTLVVAAAAGQEMYTRQYATARIITLDLPGEAGVYFVRIQDGENRHVLKVVKQ